MISMPRAPPMPPYLQVLPRTSSPITLQPVLLLRFHLWALLAHTLHRCVISHPTYPHTPPLPADISCAEHALPTRRG